MRHIRSILYSLVLAPAAWVLAGVGLTGDLTARGRDGFAVENFTGLLLLLLAGAAYGILVLGPISPAGPLLAGVVYLAIASWALTSPSAYADIWPPSVAKDGFDLSRPGYGLAALLAVPLICTALSARRWEKYEPPVLPLIGQIGRARGAAPAAGTPLAAIQTTVIGTPPAFAGLDADPTTVLRFPTNSATGPAPDPAPAAASLIALPSDDPTTALPAASAIALPAASAIALPADASATALPAAPTESTTVVAPPDDDTTADVPNPAEPSPEGETVTVFEAIAVLDEDPTAESNADQDTAPVTPADEDPTAPVESSDSEEPTAPVESSDSEEPTAVAQDDEPPTSPVEDADEVTEPVASSEDEDEDEAADPDPEDEVDESVGGGGDEVSAVIPLPLGDRDERTQVVRLPVGEQAERTQVVRLPVGDAAERTQVVRLPVGEPAEVVKLPVGDGEARTQVVPFPSPDPDEKTQVIKLPKPPGDTTQVLQFPVRSPGAEPGQRTRDLSTRATKDVGGDETQVIRLADKTVDDEKTQVIRPALISRPGETTDVLKFRPPAPRKDAPVPNSIADAEAPNFAEDPTSPIIPPTAADHDDEATQPGKRSSMTVLNLERPQDELADDPTRPLEIPTQRRPQDSD